MSNYKLLDGIKVVEMSTMVAAPSCGRILADWGAEVIKVEAPNGDNYRNFGKMFGVTCTPDANPLFDSINANKKGVTLNLKDSADMDKMHQLLSDADIFLTNTRPKALKALGIDYDTLREKYPKLIYALLSGYGEKGPKADAPGYDTIAFWASTGFLADMTVLNDEDKSNFPVMGPAGPGDIISGMALLNIILGALYKRTITNEGDYVTASLYGTALWCFHIMSVSVEPQFDNKYPKKRNESNPLSTPFKTSDGEWIMTTILDFPKDWPRICRVLELEEMIEDPKYDTVVKQRDASIRNELMQIFGRKYEQKTAEEWMTLLKEADIVHDKLGHYSDIYQCEQADANEFIHSVDYGLEKDVVLVRPNMLSARNGYAPFNKAPKLGEHNDMFDKNN